MLYIIQMYKHASISIMVVNAAITIINDGILTSSGINLPIKILLYLNRSKQVISYTHSYSLISDVVIAKVAHTNLLN